MADAKLGEELVDGLNAQFGRFEGRRAIHAKGVGLRGSFDASGAAAELTIAPHLQRGSVSVVARFSSGDGKPTASDGAAFSRGFAVRFLLEDGRETDLLSIVSPTFITSDPKTFLELIRALRPDAATGEPNGLAVAELALRHPITMGYFVRQQQREVPDSFATVRWHAVHAFGMTNAAGERCHVRYTWVPVDAEATIPRAHAETRGPDYLMRDARARIEHGGAIGFDLSLTVAAPEDPLDRPDREWPSDRRSLVVGRLTLSALEEVEALGFRPGRLVEGIERPDDRILDAREAAYAVSRARREE